MSTGEILSPVYTKSMMYPQLGILKPRRKYYQCPRCQGNVRVRLQRQIVRREEMIFGFYCDDCHKNWYISSKLILNDIFEEQVQRMARFTKETGKEFGALIIKTPDGIRLDMIEVGKNREVTFKQTHELKENEKIVGTIHNHPESDTFSDYDIASFLRDEWEKISIVNGARGTVSVMVKTQETVQINDADEFIKQYGGQPLKDIARIFKFLVFKGNTNNLQLISGMTPSPSSSLEKLLRGIE